MDDDKETGETAMTDREIVEHSAHGAGPGGAFVVGPAELVRGAPSGPLVGTTLAVKDLFDVAGTRTGAGNPGFLAEAPVATVHAAAVSALVAAGATVVGKTVTDELAYSLSGTNVHYGTPVNPADPTRVPGGSSSGSAVAVATGAVDLALGTDTGGSVRVPASYCGIFGIRPSHGRVSVSGVVPLAPSLDTVGLFSRSAQLLRTAFAALVGTEEGSPTPPTRLVLARPLWALADAAVGAALEELSTVLALAAECRIEWVDEPEAGTLEGALAHFRALQLYEAWQSHGEWITQRTPDLGPGVASRFSAAAAATADGARAALVERARLGRYLDSLLGEDAVLLQPAASGVAPPIALAAPDKEDLRRRTLGLCAFAGLAGAPVVVVPGARTSGLPVGLAIVGRPGADEVVVDLAARAEQATREKRAIESDRPGELSSETISPSGGDLPN